MGSYKFALRSSYGLDAWVSNQSPKHSNINKSVAAPALTSPGGLTGVFGGGQIVDISCTTGQFRGVGYFGLQNIGPFNPGLSILMRIVPKWSGAPSATVPLFMMGFLGPSPLSFLEAAIDTSGAFFLNMYNKNGSFVVSAEASGPCSFTANTATDIQLSWDGSSGTGKIFISQDGVIVGTIDVPVGSDISAFDYSQMDTITFGTTFDWPVCNYYLNEAAIADYAVPTTYPVRTGFLPLAFFDSTLSTDPGAANVLTGTSYEINGVSETGSLVSTDPGQSNVKSGTAYEINNSAKTGSMVNTDPGVGNVRSGINYEIENVPKTGTLVSTDPGVANVAAGVNYEINSVPKTGTLQVVINEFVAATLLGQNAIAVPKGQVAIEFTQGDSVVLQMVATDGDGNPVNIQGATFTTEMRGPNGTVITFDNSKHAIVDAANGLFTLTLSADDTNSLGTGTGKDIITQVVQGSSSIWFRGTGILAVYPAIPIQ